MRWFYWTPRVLIIVYGLFLAIFAFDVFETGTLAEQLLAFAIHLIPTYLIFIALAIAWKRERIGAGILAAIGLFFTIFFDTYRQPISFLLVSLPPFILAGLFYLGSRSENLNTK